ncbi:MAG: hypothetical protein J3Q66DRAFT_414766 [Benniella sp.]|nr:MAG: hypothetical protein J3Q66DRAFT_414766 [Benniella sp.]
MVRQRIAKILNNVKIISDGGITIGHHKHHPQFEDPIIRSATLVENVIENAFWIDFHDKFDQRAKFSDLVRFHPGITLRHEFWDSLNAVSISVRDEGVLKEILDQVSGIKVVEPVIMHERYRFHWTTLGAYRVFGCRGGTSNDIIMKALLRAAGDGMQLINLSLGGPGGWPQDREARLAGSLTRNGTIIVAAMGNEGHMGLFEASSPDVAETAITVASTENEFKSSIYFTVDQTSVKLIDPSQDMPRPILYNRDFEMDLTNTTLVQIAPGISGHIKADACKPIVKDLKGKIALIRRGDCTFKIKIANAAITGAVGVIFMDNVQSSGFGADSAGATIRVRTITLDDGEYLLKNISLNDTTHMNSNQKITLSNNGRTPLQYEIDILPAAGLMPFDQDKMIDDAPKIVTAGASVRSLKSITVEPGASTTVDLEFSGPNTDPPKYAIYSGYVRFTPKDVSPESPVMHIPFLGMQGDYNKVSILDPSIGLHIFDALGHPLRINKVKAGVAHDQRKDIIPLKGKLNNLSRPMPITDSRRRMSSGVMQVVFRMITGTEALVLDLVSDKGDDPRDVKSYGVLNNGVARYVPRNDLLEGNAFQVMGWDGQILKEEGSLTSVIGGSERRSYRLRISVLKHFGDLENDMDYESHLSDPFTLP